MRPYERLAERNTKLATKSPLKGPLHERRVNKSKSLNQKIFQCLLWESSAAFSRIPWKLPHTEATWSSRTWLCWEKIQTRFSGRLWNQNSVACLNKEQNNCIRGFFFHELDLKFSGEESRIHKVAFDYYNALRRSRILGMNCYLVICFYLFLLFYFKMRKKYPCLLCD